MAHRGQHAVQDYVLQQRPLEIEAVLEEPPGLLSGSRAALEVPLRAGGGPRLVATAAAEGDVEGKSDSFGRPSSGA